MTPPPAGGFELGLASSPRPSEVTQPARMLGLRLVAGTWTRAIGTWRDYWRRPWT